jgi:MFS family permease
MTATRRQSLAMTLYALAFFGAHLSFIPLLTLLIPRRIDALDPANPIRSLSILLLAGGITASVSHIVAGRWSDGWISRHGNRNGLIAIGLALLLATMMWLAFAQTFAMMLGAIIAFQFALNLMFAPLGALLADHVPDRLKGRMSGWLNASLPLSNAGTFLAAYFFPRDGAGGFFVIIAMVAIAIVPLVVAWPFGAVETKRVPIDAQPLARPVVRDFVRLWSARAAVQIGAVFIINYFYLYLATRLSADESTRQMGTLAIAALVASVISALGAGYWSDARQRRRPPMVAAAIGCAIGLLILASQPAWPLLVMSFMFFHVGLTSFLAVDAAMVSQLLGDNPRRGEMLGYMNLTNTLPSIVVPFLGLTVSGNPDFGSWSFVFLATAALAIIAAALVAKVKSVA